MPEDDFRLRRRGGGQNLGRGGADSGYTGVPGPDFGLDDGLMSVEDGSMASQLHLTRAHLEHERYPDQVVIDGPVESIMLDEMDEVGTVAYEKPAPIIDQPHPPHHHQPPQTGITMEEAFNRHIQSQDQGTSITHHPSTPRSTTQPAYLGQATPPEMGGLTLHGLGLIHNPTNMQLQPAPNGLTVVSIDDTSPHVLTAEPGLEADERLPGHWEGRRVIDRNLVDWRNEQVYGVLPTEGDDVPGGADPAVHRLRRLMAQHSEFPLDATLYPCPSDDNAFRGTATWRDSFVVARVRTLEDARSVGLGSVRGRNASQSEYGRAARTAKVLESIKANTKIECAPDCLLKARLGRHLYRVEVDVRAVEIDNGGEFRYRVVRHELHWVEGIIFIWCEEGEAVDE